jgi:hypothetical protein
MNRYRFATLALVTCVAGVSLAACSAGITSAPPAASSPAASTSHPASARPASDAGTTVSVGGSIGRFPIPPGATVIENGTDNNEIVILLGTVTPAEVSRFYTSALPRDGYKITTNTMTTLNNGAGAAIEFTGHGYKGTIGAESGLATTGAGQDVTNGKSLVGITLTPR